MQRSISHSCDCGVAEYSKQSNSGLKMPSTTKARSTGLRALLAL